jgi:D-aminoacyl-tRNA deacylase
MRALVQRVTSASVTIDGEVVGAIDHGLCVLVGVTHDDSPESCSKLAAKVANLRIFEGEQSLLDTGGAALVVSQFTLYGDTRKGRRPTWSAAAPAEVAEPRVDALVAALRARGVRVETGRFRAHMAVSLVNDGPVTLIVETGSA